MLIITDTFVFKYFFLHHAACKTADTYACKHSVSCLYIQPTSWRWTVGFEIRRRHDKLQYKFKKVHFIGLYCIIVQIFISIKSCIIKICKTFMQSFMCVEFVGSALTNKDTHGRRIWGWFDTMVRFLIKVWHACTSVPHPTPHPLTHTWKGYCHSKVGDN